MSPRHCTTSLVATLGHLPGPEELSTLPAEVEWLEVRADLVGTLDETAVEGLVASGKKLLWTLRSRPEGGAGDWDGERRLEPLLTAAAGPWHLVDLEAERDLVPELLAAIPPERRLLSWHGAPGSLAELEGRLESMVETPARAYKLIPEARQAGDEIAPLALLAGCGRPDVVAFALGEPGAWTRPVAAALGAPFLFGAFAADRPGAPGQMTVARLVEDFGLPELPPVEMLCGIVGSPVGHSLSPRLHNRGYRELGIPALYVPFEVEQFGDFWLEVIESGRLDVIGLPIRGLSVTAPYKEIALAVAGAASPRAQSIGAANTLVRTASPSGDVWEAESTDPEGVLVPLAEHGIEPRGLAVAVVGAGGAGRAAAVGLLEAGARVTLVNRSRKRGEAVAEELGLAFVSLVGLDPSPYRVIVHATSLGHRPDDPLPFEPGRLAEDAVVVDLVYARDRPTALTAAVRAAGRTAIDGREVLAAQAFQQFRMMTGHELPAGLARKTLGLPSAAAGEAAP